MSSIMYSVGDMHKLDSFIIVVCKRLPGLSSALFFLHDQHARIHWGGGGGGGLALDVCNPFKNLKVIRFLRKLVQFPWKNYLATHPAFNIGSSF